MAVKMMTMLRSALLLLSLAVATLANDENITWTGCGPYTNEAQRLTIGKDSVVCLQAANDLNWVNGAQYLRFSFSPTVDEYSRFHVAGSYNDLVNAANTPFSGRNISVAVTSQQRVSFLRQYYDVQRQLIYPHLTAIIDVGSGKVKGVTWDDACVFCGGNECDPITYNYEGQLQSSSDAGQPIGGCPLTVEECARDTAACDLTLYVVWTGSDSDGHSFQSSASRFSMFPPQDLQDRWTQNLPTIPGTGNSQN